MSRNKEMESEKEDEIINWFLQVLKGKIEYIKKIWKIYQIYVSHF
jgi:hypothetical protein